MKPPRHVRRSSDLPQTIWYLCSPYVIGLAMMLFIGSFVLKFDSTHNIMMGIGLILIVQQIFTRYQFARSLPYLKIRDGKLLLSRNHQLQEIALAGIRTVKALDIYESVPWSRDKIQFSAIDIFTDQQTEPLRAIFAPGMQRRRDETYSLLTEWLDIENLSENSVICTEPGDEENFDYDD